MSGEMVAPSETHRQLVPPSDSERAVAVPSGEQKDFTVPRVGQVSPDRPFKPSQLSRIDEAITLASRETGLTFSVYVGPLPGNTRATAEQMFDKLAATHAAPVLVAISPGQRRLEIVTGGESAARIPNRLAGLAALGMRASFTNGDLTGGIVNGLRQLADAAGQA
ncbi:MAG: hypothetical protein QOK10_2570 [Pseudonocardiales bacterium]|nr:hypothetical protein [Pseudonocardiales bacterium]